MKEVDELAEALSKIAEPITLEIPAGLAVVLVAQVQLALRHPGNRGAAADLARGFARRVQDLLAAQTPGVGDMLEQGWHECFDVPAGSAAGMKTAQEIRHHRDDLVAALALPCNCRRGAHALSCVRGGKMVEVSISILSWALGEGEEYATIVEGIRATVKRTTEGG